MTAASHQTIDLSAGRHQSPEDGACVMELSSMLSGEAFSDRPRNVCRVIGAFLRTYNDRVDHDKRQDLKPYASLVVGTRAGTREEQRRARICIEWARRMAGAPPLRVRLLYRLLHRQALDLAGVYAARVALASPDREQAHRQALALLEELIAVTHPIDPDQLSTPAADKGELQALV